MKYTLLLRVFLRHALRIKSLRRWQNVGYTKPSLFRYRNCQKQLLREKKEEILKNELSGAERTLALGTKICVSSPRYIYYPS